MEHFQNVGNVLDIGTALLVVEAAFVTSKGNQSSYKSRPLMLGLNVLSARG